MGQAGPHPRSRVVDHVHEDERHAQAVRSVAVEVRVPGRHYACYCVATGIPGIYSGEIWTRQTKGAKVMSVKLFVGGLSFSTSSEGLRGAFARFGEVMSAAVMTDRETGRSRGFGFVEMATTEEAEKAISSLNGTSLDGRMIRVDKATPRGAGGPRPPRPAGGPRPYGDRPASGGGPGGPRFGAGGGGGGGPRFGMGGPRPGGGFGDR